MDPQATLQLIEDAITDDDMETAYELCGVLDNWLARGGFHPDYTNFPGAQRLMAGVEVI